MQSGTSEEKKSQIVLAMEERVRRQKELLAELERQRSGLLPQAHELLRCLIESRRIIEDSLSARLQAEPARPADRPAQPLNAEAMCQDLAQLSSHAAAQDMRMARDFLSLVQEGLMARLNQGSGDAVTHRLCAPRGK